LNAPNKAAFTGSSIVSIGTDGKLSRGFSLYLDLVRVTASLAVVLYHASFEENGGDWFHFGTIGPDAVTVFLFSPVW